MAYDTQLLTRVREALAQVHDVEEKKMFGSMAFMVRGKMCLGVGAERLMCRIDPAQHDAALQREGCQTVMMRGRQYRGYVHVNKECLQTKAALQYWVELALDYNQKIS